MFSEGSYNRSKRVWNEEIVVGILFFFVQHKLAHRFETWGKHEPVLYPAFP